MGYKNHIGARSEERLWLTIDTALAEPVLIESTTATWWWWSR